MFVALLTMALADTLVEGDKVRVYFDAYGTWNSTDAGRGLEALHGGEWKTWTYPGYPWSLLALEYGGASAYARSDNETTTFLYPTEADLSSDTWLLAAFGMDAADDLHVTETVTWEPGGQALRVGFQVTNRDLETHTDVRLLFQLDGDVDYAAGAYTTRNDVYDTDDDTIGDVAVSLGPYSDYALGFGGCDPATTTLGHVANWYGQTDADVAITDEDGREADDAITVRFDLGDLDPMETVEAVVVVLFGDDGEAIEDLWADGRDPLCAPCDEDGDGYGGPLCAGTDCDDDDPFTYPGAPEVWYDGYDEDCLGGDDYDQDRDGHASDAYRGDDCDDTDPGVLPGAPENWYDGKDQDCDGNDTDRDLDGYDADVVGGPDCDDGDPAVNPDADEVWYDDVDQDCDGNDDDQDGDGVLSPTDCDDTDPYVYPGAGGESGDGVDSDCDGSDDDVAVADGGDGLRIQGECGCASTPAPTGLAALVGALALLRRRRR